MASQEQGLERELEQKRERKLEQELERERERELERERITMSIYKIVVTTVEKQLAGTGMVWEATAQVSEDGVHKATTGRRNAKRVTAAVLAAESALREAMR